MVRALILPLLLVGLLVAPLACSSNEEQPSVNGTAANTNSSAETDIDTVEESANEPAADRSVADTRSPSTSAPAEHSGNASYRLRQGLAGGGGGATNGFVQGDAEEERLLTDRERHHDYGENEMIPTAEDALSTFGIDVDTAAYTLMRDDILNRESLPDPAGVRAEEYVNYFDYDYETPTADGPHPFSVSLAAAPSPFRSGRHLLRVGVQGYEVPVDKRTPANLVFLVDVSGSMRSVRNLPLVKHSLKTLVDRLAPHDRIAIVTYSREINVALESTPLDSAKSEILAIIDGLQAGGSTAGGPAIEEAYEVAQAGFLEEGENKIILCTDGDFNFGLQGDELIEFVEAKRDAGVEMNIFLYGRGNINDADMQRIAQAGNGTYAYIDSKSASVRALGDNIVGMLQTIAKDVKIQVEFDPTVVAEYRLIGYESRDIADQDFRNDKVDAGELGAGHNVTAYYEITLAEGADLAEDADATLATVRLRYKAPDATSDDEATEVAEMIAAAELVATFEEASADFQFGAAVVEYAQIMKRSRYVTRMQFAEILRIAEETTGDDPDRLEFIKIAAAASDLPELYLREGEVSE